MPSRELYTGFYKTHTQTRTRNSWCKEFNVSHDWLQSRIDDKSRDFQSIIDEAMKKKVATKSETKSIMQNYCLGRPVNSKIVF